MSPADDGPGASQGSGDAPGDAEAAGEPLFRVVARSVVACLAVEVAAGLLFVAAWEAASTGSGLARLVVLRSLGGAPEVVLASLGAGAAIGVAFGLAEAAARRLGAAAGVAVGVLAAAVVPSGARFAVSLASSGSSVAATEDVVAGPTVGASPGYLLLLTGAALVYGPLVVARRRGWGALGEAAALSAGGLAFAALAPFLPLVRLQSLPWSLYLLLVLARAPLLPPALRLGDAAARRALAWLGQPAEPPAAPRAPLGLGARLAAAAVVVAGLGLATFGLTARPQERLSTLGLRLAALGGEPGALLELGRHLANPHPEDAALPARLWLAARLAPEHDEQPDWQGAAEVFAQAAERQGAPSRRAREAEIGTGASPFGDVTPCLELVWLVTGHVHVNRVPPLLAPAEVAGWEAWLRTRAEAGDLDACYGLGQLLCAPGGPRRIGEGIRWLDRAAAAGHGYALRARLEAWEVEGTDLAGALTAGRTLVARFPAPAPGHEEPWWAPGLIAARPLLNLLCAHPELRRDEDDAWLPLLDWFLGSIDAQALRAHAPRLLAFAAEPPAGTTDAGRLHALGRDAEARAAARAALARGGEGAHEARRVLARADVRAELARPRLGRARLALAAAWLEAACRETDDPESHLLLGGLWGLESLVSSRYVDAGGPPTPYERAREAARALRLAAALAGPGEGRAEVFRGELVAAARALSPVLGARAYDPWSRADLVALLEERVREARDRRQDARVVDLCTRLLRLDPLPAWAHGTRGEARLRQGDAWAAAFDLDRWAAGAVAAEVRDRARAAFDDAVRRLGPPAAPLDFPPVAPPR